MFIQKHNENDIEILLYKPEEDKKKKDPLPKVFVFFDI